MDSPSLDLLVPTGRAGTIAPDPTESELRALYGRLDGVRANMVSTLDGAAHGPDHRSGSINDAADFRVFQVLRSLADVVLVGAGTVRAEGYRGLRTAESLVPARRADCLPDHPTLAIVTGRGDLPADVLAVDPTPYVVTVAHATYLGHLRAHLPPGHLLMHDGDTVDLARALRQLSDVGLSNVLTEGGPAFLGALLSQGLVDELCLTWTPLVLGGDASRIVEGAAWRGRRRAHLASLLHADGTLAGRWQLSGGLRDEASIGSAT